MCLENCIEKNNIEGKVIQNEMNKELKIGYKQGDINNLQRTKRMKASLYQKKTPNKQSFNKIVKILLTWP